MSWLFSIILLPIAIAAYLTLNFVLLLVTFSGFLVGIANNLQNHIFSDTNTVVNIGWAITRDIANLGFILVIIILAISVILRIKEYEFQKYFPKLIFSIIAVNFSFEITKIFINFSHVLANFFLSKISANPLEIGSILLGAFGPHRLTKGLNLENTLAMFNSLTDVVMFMLISPLAASIFGIILFFVMLVLAFLLLIRFLYLSLLIILLPIEILLNLIPSQKNVFNEWKDKFINQTLFYPAVSFFIYLAFQSAFTITELKKGAADTKIFGNTSSGLVEIFQTGVDMIILSGILIGGLIAAEKFGAVGAKAINSYLQNKIQKKAAEKGKELAYRTAERFIPEKATEKMARLGQNKNYFLRVMALPIRFVGGSLNKIHQQNKNLMQEKQNKLKDFDNNQLTNNFIRFSTPEKVAALSILAERGRANKNKIKEAEQNYKQLEDKEKKLQERIKLNLKIINDPNSSAKEKTEARKDNLEIEIQLKNIQNEKIKANNEIQKSKANYKKFEESLEKLPKVIKEALKNSDFNLKILSEEIKKAKKTLKQQNKGKIFKPTLSYILRKNLEHNINKYYE